MGSGLIPKLQYAIKTEGLTITIPTTQFYSENLQKFVKVYHIKHGRKELYSNASQVNIIKFLARLLDILRENKGIEEKKLIEKLEEEFNETS